MDIFLNNIVPYVGTDIFKLYTKYEDIKTILDKENLEYIEETWCVEGETIPNPWKIINVPEIISFFFASNNKLFKIVFWNNYKGKLSNGISVGSTIDEAKNIDSTISYNEWDEIYESSYGYWLESDFETNKMFSITVFIKEIDSDNFDECNW